MPFNFQLLIEFFFSGVITLVSILLLYGVIDPVKTKELLKLLDPIHTNVQIAFLVFIGGLISYYLGTVVNALSNKIIREFFSGYRIKMIRRKLGISQIETKESEEPKKSGLGKILFIIKQMFMNKKYGNVVYPKIENIDNERLSYIQDILPKQIAKENTVGRKKNENKFENDGLKELYTAVRNYCGINSDHTTRMVSYHWGLLRLSRATILPLILLLLVLIIHLFIAGNETLELFSIGVVVTAIVLTIISYRYREKFLIYTVFDIFFISQKSSKAK